jgi:hypothetical protein
MKTRSPINHRPVHRNSSRTQYKHYGALVGRHPVKTAFTLLEVLMAIGLSMILLFAVYESIHLYMRISTIGQEDMKRAQIVRALFSMMSEDIGCVVYRPEDTSDADVAPADDDPAGGDPDAIDDADFEPDEETSDQSIGVFGDASTLLLNISKPTRQRRNRLQDESSEASGFGADLQAVAYFIAGADGGGTLQEAVGSQATDRNGEPASGLARMQGDRLAMNLADETGDLDMMASNSTLLAKEVIFLQFRYFDGFEWYEEWDSDLLGGVPMAIEIIIGFASPVDEETEGGLLARSANQSTNEYRLVVKVPIAEPIETLDDLSDF